MALVLIDRTAGTNIGNMTQNGGLAAAFDGTTDQAGADSAQGPIENDQTAHYIGKTLAAGKKFGRAIVYGSNNQGFWTNGTPEVILNVYGKAGTAPSSSTDGTLVGSATFTDPNNGTPTQIESTNTTTTWDHIWVQYSFTVDVGGNNKPHCAELVLYEFVAGGAAKQFMHHQRMRRAA